MIVEAALVGNFGDAQAGFLSAANQKYLAEQENIHVCQGNIWSLLGCINQKQTRPQDQPGPLAALPEEDRALIRSILPELGA